MNGFVALALVSLLAAPTPSSRATSVKRGKATASARVEGRKATISVRRGRAQTGATLELGMSCNAKKLEGVLARELAQNARAFRGLPSATTLRLAKNRAGVQNLERGLAVILEAGKHVTRGGHGSTQFAGFKAKLGPIPRPGESKTVGGRGTTTKVTGLPRGGAKIIRTVTGRGGVRDVTEVTLGGDGASSVVRTFTFGKGQAGVTLTESSSFDSDGNQTGGFSKVHTGGGAVFQDDQSSGGGGGGSTDPTPSGGDGGGGDDQNEENPNKQSQAGLADKPSGGDGGGGETGQNDETGNDTSSGGVTMSDGTLSVPGVSIGDSTAAAAINWNRLGGAVTTPDPTGGDDTGVDGGGRGGSLGGPVGGCGQIEQAGFDPNPAFLRPDKLGRWDIDFGPLARRPGR